MVWAQHARRKFPPLHRVLDHNQRLEMVLVAHSSRMRDRSDTRKRCAALTPLCPELLARLLLRLVRLAPMPADPLRVREWHRQASDCSESWHRPTHTARPGFEPPAS